MARTTARLSVRHQGSFDGAARTFDQPCMAWNNSSTSIDSTKPWRQDHGPTDTGLVSPITQTISPGSYSDVRTT